MPGKSHSRGPLRGIAVLAFLPGVAERMRTMPRLLFAVLVTFALAGCSALETPGAARYFSNHPGGLPFLKIGSGMRGPTLAVLEPDGTWSKPRVMKPVRADQPPISTTPGLAALVENAHRIDDYVFLEFKPDAKLHDRPLPSRYFLLPGGFAYPSQPPGR